MYEIRKNDKNKIQEFLKEKFDIECKDIQLKRDGKIQNENEHHIEIEPIGGVFVLHLRENNKYKGVPPTYKYKEIYKAEFLYNGKEYDVPIDVATSVKELWFALKIHDKVLKNMERR